MSVISPITFRLHATDDRFSITDGIRKWGISSVCTAHTKCSAYVDNRCLHNTLCVFKYEYESFHIYIYTYIVVYKTSPVWFSFSFVVLFSSQLFVVYCIHITTTCLFRSHMILNAGKVNAIKQDRIIWHAH